MSSSLDLHSRNDLTRRSVGNTLRRSETLVLSALCSDFSFHFLALLLVTLFLVSCGGAVSSGPPPPITVTVAPGSAQPFAGTSVQFTATVQNASNSSVNWLVNTAPGGNTTLGTVSPTGLYAAPASVPTPPTVMVTAALQSDSTKTGSSSVTIQPQTAIQGPLVLSPVLSSLTTSQTLQLQVSTAGVTNSQVNWAVDGVANGNTLNGTITSDGLYTPSSTAGAHLITATLKANPSAIGSAQVEVTDFTGTFTWRYDNSRSGQNRKELALFPRNVTSSTFGKLFSCPVDGYTYAQPLYVANLAIPGKGTRNVVFVATEKDTVFAFDADANPCVQLWHTSLIPAGEEAVPTPNLQITSDDISPFIGITGTPVIDANSSTLFLVAKTWTAPPNPVFHQRLYALELGTGQPKIQPSGVQISTPGSVSPNFSAVLENQRAALLFDNNTIYIAFASHHDQGDYHGWMLGYGSSTLQQTSVFDVTPSGTQGGIWQSGGGPSADLNHNIFFTTGNGTFDANRGGPNFGESFLRLSGAGALSLADYFSPCNEAVRSSADQDVGSTAQLLLPDSAGSVAKPHLMIGGAKDGSLYVLNRDNLGTYNGICPDSSTRAQIVPVGDASIFSTPLFWNNFIYVAAGNGKLKAFSMTGGVLAQSPLSSQSPETLGLQGATPIVSSNGLNNAIIWLIDTNGALATPNGSAILRAFDASNLSNEIYSSALLPTRDSAGLAVKFTVPTEANGKVYVGTQTELDVYGLLH